MLKKGASRKGMRRRQALAASASVKDEDVTVPVRKPAVVKLEPIATPAKEITRIEPNTAAPPAEVISPSKAGEQTWGRQKSLYQHRFVWYFFTAAIVLMFCAIAYVISRSDPNSGTSATMPFALEVVNEETPIRLPMPLYQQNPYQVQLRCTDILRQVADARDPQTIPPLARSTPTLEASLRRHWKRWESMPKIEQNDELLIDVTEVQGRDFLMISGLCENGSPFLAFFVEIDQRIVIDWEATMGVGEAKIDTLTQHPTEHPITMRAIVSPSPYYLPSLPETDYESFQLTFAGSDSVIWGYAPRGSLAHQQINALLLQQNELLEVVNEARVTLRLRKTPGPSSQYRFFITEVLHKDWVMP
ncbi:MAG: hypothetical protein EAZ81_05300 [Verrucomicrobia bacterium]|nr:MAG: hypothetical protein EAZ81_05300 [Verrucomicrobiota bacterium]